MHVPLTKRQGRPQDGAPKVVVLGAGFGGLHTLRWLERLLQSDLAKSCCGIRHRPIQDAPIVTAQSTQIYGQNPVQTSTRQKELG